MLLSSSAAVSAIKAQIQAANGMIKVRPHFRILSIIISGCPFHQQSVFLVGGYAASPWLFACVAFIPLLNCLIVPLIFIRQRQLQERLAPYKVKVSRPDTQTYASPIYSKFVNFYQPPFFVIAPKLWLMALSGSTVITTSLPACQSSCMASSFLENSTPPTLIMNGGRKGFVSSLQDPSFYRMRLIVFYRG